MGKWNHLRFFLPPSTTHVYLGSQPPTHTTAMKLKASLDYVTTLWEGNLTIKCKLENKLDTKLIFSWRGSVREKGLGRASDSSATSLSYLVLFNKVSEPLNLVSMGPLPSSLSVPHSLFNPLLFLSLYLAQYYTCSYCNVGRYRTVQSDQSFAENIYDGGLHCVLLSLTQPNTFP